MKGSFRTAGFVLGWTLNAQARITDAALAKLSDCSSSGAASERLQCLHTRFTWLAVLQRQTLVISQTTSTTDIITASMLRDMPYEADIVTSKSLF